MFLSIVIPVYNSARYLPKCLASIWSQGMPETDYEVVCVDDCSSDDSLEVLHQEAQSHPNLRVLHNATNLRAGGARNHGVKEAKGEYIQFIDSDDYFHPESLLKAYAYQKEHLLDILVCDMSRESCNQFSTVPILNYPHRQIMTGRQFLIKNGFPGGPTKYLFKRSLMMANQVWFAETVCAEDPDWTWKLPFYAHNMQYLPIILHHYVLHPESSVGAEFKSAKAIFDRIRTGKRIFSLRTLYIDPDEKERIKAFAERTYRIGLLYFCSQPLHTKEKTNIVVEEIPSNEFYHGIIFFARENPRLYAVLSSIAAPIFLILLYVKRLFFGRK